MKRILVIGCCGAGKSTFSLRLGEILSIPLIHLDEHYWKPNWVETSRDEWVKVVRELCNRPQWIMDGNYINTLSERMAFADTVFFMDYNTITCLDGAFRRLLLKKRPDPIAGCKERIDLDFLKWILGFKKKQTDRINLLLSSSGPDKQVYVFKKRKDSKKYLAKISSEIKKNG